MAVIRETGATKAPALNTFGGRRGSKKTLMLTLAVSAAVIAAGALYLFPQLW